MLLSLIVMNLAHELRGNTSLSQTGKSTKTGHAPGAFDVAHLT
jgi:hypothetical protein